MRAEKIILLLPVIKSEQHPHFASYKANVCSTSNVCLSAIWVIKEISIGIKKITYGYYNL